VLDIPTDAKEVTVNGKKVWQQDDTSSLIFKPGRKWKVEIVK
jgi:hypothetical protein